jgi:two-component system chemotaxis sensor kinase CheA
MLNQILPHLLRFVFNYGIEDEDERARLGKSTTPSLTLGIERQDRLIVVTLVDDGRGINPAQTRSLAVERGVMTRMEADALSDQAAQSLLFSLTPDAAEDSLSGVREVGLDLIVQRLKHEYAADIAIQSTPRVGTAVIISIPLADE